MDKYQKPYIEIIDLAPADAILEGSKTQTVDMGDEPLAPGEAYD